MSDRAGFGALLTAVKAAGQDYEFYPTTDRMLDVIADHIPADAKSLLDIGAGDGRVLCRLAKKCPNAELYSIEKSNVLIEAQPECVIPVGTDLFQQNLACLPVDYLTSNPPYSEFEAWACMIIESGHAKKAFLILPQRWKDNAGIALALKKRGAKARVIGSDDFFDGVRQARAVIDIIEVRFPRKDERWDREVQDPFDVWFDLNVGTFDAEEAPDAYSEYQREQQGIAKVRDTTSTIEEMVEAYLEEYARMEQNYRAIFQLDYAILKELGVNKENVREGLKKKMAGLKSKYWLVLFERLSAITDRLSTATKAEFTERLTGRVAIAFTANNAYAVVLWAIKNANKYFDQQTVALYRDLSTFDGVMNYKSNQKTWKRDDWRYSRRYHLEEGETRPERYALDYRIVIERWKAIGYDSWEYPGNLAKSCHELISDVTAVLFNLGFPTRSPYSMTRQWRSGGWQNWHRAGGEEILFQAKAFQKGTIHFRFLPEAMRALNCEAGRLLGWLREPADVVEELGYSETEAVRFFGSTKQITPAAGRLLLGSGEATDGV